MAYVYRRAIYNSPLPTLIPPSHKLNASLYYIKDHIVLETCILFIYIYGRVVYLPKHHGCSSIFRVYKRPI